MNSEQTPIPKKPKMKLHMIAVTTIDEHYKLHQKAYISQNPYTDRWAVRIVEPDENNRVTLYPYNQILKIIMEDEDD